MRRYMPSAHSASVPSKMRAFLIRSGVIGDAFLFTEQSAKGLRRDW